MVSYAGRTGSDPDVKYLPSGSVVCNLTLAVRRRSKDDKPDWVNLTLWGKTAEVAANYVRKGSLIGVTGALGKEHWTDRATGAPRSRPFVNVDRLDLLGSRNDGENQGASHDEF
jgi:single-strand DNA-binding protein